MAFSTQSTAASSKRFTDKFAPGLNLNWGERIVAVVASSIAVLIVATIAVLMGMD